MYLSGAFLGVTEGYVYRSFWSGFSGEEICDSRLVGDVVSSGVVDLPDLAHVTLARLGTSEDCPGYHSGGAVGF